jgi:hypothetical protein
MSRELRELNREQCNNILVWEKIEQDITNGKHTYRAKVPGGWLVRFINTAVQPQDCDYLFIVDPKYTWEVKEDKPSE